MYKLQLKYARILCFLFALGFQSVFSQNGTWEQTNGPHAGGVNAITVSSDGDIFAGTLTEGVYRSSDQGQTWTQINNGLLDLWIHSILIHPNGDIFIGSHSYGIFRSSNNGNTWNSIPLQNAYSHISLAVHPNGDIFAGMGNFILRSSDRGENWEKVNEGMDNESIDKIFITPDSLMLAGTESGLFLSEDNGVTWTRKIQDNWIRAIQMNSSGQIFVAGQGVYRSDDEGDTWILLDSNLPNPHNADLFITADDDIFISKIWNGASVFMSLDNGNNWVSRDDGINDSSVRCFAEGSNGILYAGTSHVGHVYQSTNKGEQWTNLSIDHFYNTIYSLELNSQATLFAGGLLGNFKSVDQGETWQDIPYYGWGMWDWGATDLAINQNDEIFSCTAKSSYLFYSEDNGDNWSEMTEFDNVTWVEIDENDDIFIGTENDSLLCSKDNGENWVNIGSPQFTEGVEEIAFNSRGYIYVAANQNEIYRSTDSCSSWQSLGSIEIGDRVSSLFIDSNDHIFIGTWWGRVYRSNDFGDSWERVDSDLFTGSTGSPINAFAESSGGIVFVCSDYNGIYYSSDNGETWLSYNDGLTENRIFDIEINDNDKLFAGTEGGGVFKTALPTADVDDAQIQFSTAFSMKQNYPNPFNPATTIAFTIPWRSPVTLKVYDINGREIQTLVDRTLASGRYEVQFDGNDCPSGIYLYAVQAGAYRSVRKMTLLK